MKQTLAPFVIADGDIGMGASLGNSAIWVNTKSTGAIERVFCNAVEQSLIGAITMRYGGKGTRNTSYIALHKDGGRKVFEIHPAYQRVSFTFGGVIRVSETVFVPLDGSAAAHGDSPLLYVLIEMENDDVIEHPLRVVASARLRGSLTPDVQIEWNESLHALVAFNQSMPNAARVFGLSEKPAHFDTNFDFGSAYDPGRVPELDDSLCGYGDVLGQLQHDVVLLPKRKRTFYFRVAVSGQDVAHAVEAYRAAATAHTALERTIEHLEDVLQRSEVLTPDPLINQGALWSKVNMRRVMAAYPAGTAFTNDPGNYANVVVRDSAWFVYGNDHFMPSFSREILENIAARQYPAGKLPEYYNAVAGNVEDDGLNINDDTPLYILAVNHHYRSTGDPQWLRAMWPSVLKAARYVISQIDDRGLVFCSANDPRGNVWGIASWRNIIPNYTISGAVTEINAECAAALRAAGHLAEDMHEAAAAKEFAEASARVQQAMAAHLINPENGLYYLNIDVNGKAHTDVTGDQVFPVMLRVCDEDTGYRIISRLNFPDFWTAAGLRTISRDDPLYDPTNYYGLMGGVWPGLTWWYAFAAARYHPDFMVKALRSSFEHYGADPKKNNTVPGQFSEWFDGESLVNKGMRLSPWEPPRFLWAAIEGVCGLMLAPGEARISPLIPRYWSWVALRNLPYHGSYISYFAARTADGTLQIHASTPLQSAFPVTMYDRDVSEDVRIFSDSAAVVALASTDTTIILLGNTEANTVAVPINIAHAVKPERRYHLRIYNSERAEWEPGSQHEGRELSGLALSIEANGFRLIELTCTHHGA